MEEDYGHYGVDWIYVFDKEGNAQPFNLKTGRLIYKAPILSQKDKTFALVLPVVILLFVLVVSYFLGV